MSLRFALIGSLCTLSLALPVNAQDDLFDQFQQQESETSEERAAQSEALRQFAEILNGADRQRAMDAMEFMIANGDREIFNYAVEYGVFSADPRMQSAALRAIFENKKQYRIDHSLLDATSGYEDRFARAFQGSFDPDTNTGTVTITLGDYESSENCWFFASANRCAFILTGTSISLRDWHNTTGNLKLNEDGQLEGQLQYGTGSSPSRYAATITLLE